MGTGTVSSLSADSYALGVPFDGGSLRERTLRVRTMMQTPQPIPPPDPLAEAELAEAEDQWGVALPEEYRSFLLHVDSGGLGPVELRRLVRGSGGWAAPFIWAPKGSCS